MQIKTLKQPVNVPLDTCCSCRFAFGEVITHTLVSGVVARYATTQAHTLLPKPTV